MFTYKIHNDPERYHRWYFFAIFFENSSGIKWSIWTNQLSHWLPHPAQHCFQSFSVQHTNLQDAALYERGNTKFLRPINVFFLLLLVCGLVLLHCSWWNIMQMVLNSSLNTSQWQEFCSWHSKCDPDFLMDRQVDIFLCCSGNLTAEELLGRWRSLHW